MPYNPISGQFEYGGETYNAPTTGVGMAMEGMGAVGANVPLAFRMMENMPSITASAMFNSRRFANTMFQGGFLDVGTGASARKVARARKFGAFVGDVAERPNASGFLFGSMRSADKIKDSTQFIKASRLNNLSLRPRIFNRFSSVSNLSGVTNAGFYTPFQGASFGSGMLEKVGVRKRLASRGISAESDRPLLTGGTLGRVSTMSRAYSMENKMFGLMDKATTPGVSARRTARLTKKINNLDAQLGGLDRNTFRLARQTGALNSTATGLVDDAMSGIGVSSARSAGLKASLMEEVLAEGGPAQQAFSAQGRLRQISDTSGGVISRSITEYMGTALRPSEFAGTRAFAALERNVATALGGVGGKVAGPINPAISSKVGKFLAGETVDDIGRFGVRSLAKLSGEALGAGERMVGAKLAAMSGARALGLAMPGLNVIGTASLVYDLTKMAATGIVAAGNFAKEAVKSMQGSLHKPVFGMGYKDNEVAATSRSRGVMAIQNSRLNARSMLGSEAGMMAAHFG